MSTLKKALALILSIVMLFTMMPTTFFSFGADETCPVMMQFTAASSGDFHKYYNKVYSVTFLDKIDAEKIDGAIESWDISEAKDGSVMSWMYLNDEATATAGTDRYDVYIAGEGGVGANPNSGFIFYLFSVLEEVKGCENFKTSNATSMYGMFYECKNLRSITGINWDTSNVTDMSYMFRNCHELTQLDLSSFNTSKVTTMKYMFYYCQKLEYIYVGDGWTTESIVNLNDGVFNCCYAIMGGKELYDKEFQYFPPGAEYAKLKEDGGFLTYKVPEAPEEYTVTYEFIGDVIPDGVSIPSDAAYEEGSTVSVEANPTAEHYVFSGWTTEDAVVEDGSFVINNNVHFVGSWTKLYKVEYRYTEGFDVPEGAPDLPDAVYYKPGELVDVNGIPYVYRYLFVGWATEDADVAGAMFEMPENDVILYGYFKIPVESIEIMSEDVTINKDGTTRLNVYVKPEDATIKDIIYSSSDENVATVDKYGNITAVGEGTAEITVASKDDPTKSDTITVTVKVPVTEIAVDKTDITLKENGKDKITVTVNPDATNKEVIYESSDETVVKVDKDGNIEAIGDGEAIITVTSKDNPNLKEEIKVSVKNPVTEITVPEDEITIYVDDITSLDAKTNDDATNKILIYESDDPGIVKVDNDGNIIAVGEGTTTITITSADDPTVTKTVTVRVVYREYKVTYEFIGEIIPDGATAPTEATYKEGTEVTVEINPVADGYVFSGWSTDDVTATEGKFNIYNDVHFVGLWTKLYNVTYEYEGEVPENAPAVPGKESHKADEIVGVKDAPSVEGYIFSGWSTTDAAVANGEFAMPSKDVVLKGSFEKIINYYNVTYKYEGEIPANAPTVPGKTTYEEGSTVNVANNPTLDGYIFSGWSTADATIADGKFTINNDVEFIGSWEKLNIPVDDIKVDKTEIELEPGKTDKITVTVTPDDATNKTVTYTSSNPDVAEVTEDGTIIAKKDGETTITVKTEDGTEKAVTVKVTVKTPVKYYNVTYKYNGEIPANAPTVPGEATHEEGSTVNVANNPTLDGYIFSGWTTADAIVVDGKFTINNDVEFIGSWEKLNTPVDDIKVDKTEIELEPGKTDKITVTVTPDDATNKTVTYTSSNPDVAEVTEDGTIIAKKDGETTITVKTEDGTEKAVTVKVTVKTPVKYYNVTYKYNGEIPANAPTVPGEATHEEGSTVNVANNPTLDGYIFSGWTTADAIVVDGKFTINNDVVIVGSWSKAPGPVTEVIAPDTVTIILGEEKPLGAHVNENAINKGLTYTSRDESIVKVDANGNITAVGEGMTTITVASVENPTIFVFVTIIVTKNPSSNSKHYIVFGKTEKIGWYSVSLDGGKTFFTQFGNDHLEVTKGTEIIVKANDVFGDPFTFYINGEAAKPDENGYVRILVDKFILIGALGIPVVAPDAEESLNFIQQLIKLIKDFFAKIASWFKF